MLKNEKLKKIIKHTISPLLTIVNGGMRKNDNIVLLYSPNRGIEHNLKPLKEFLIKNNFDKRYHIICGVSSKDYFENDGLEYVTQFKALKTFLKAKHVFYTTGQIPIKPAKDQIVIHMDHGTTAIKTEGYLKKRFSGDVNFFSLYCAPSEFYREIVKKEFHCKDKNIVINSEPVTDALFKETVFYNIGDYVKLGLWTPTFRKSDYLGYDDSSEEDLLPTLKESYYEEFNGILRKNGILLIAKLHDMQDLGKYKKTKFSNLWIMSGKDFDNAGYQLYEMLKQSDFIIGDYSSVYLQYLLLDRPIGFAIPDIDRYREMRGFVVEPIEEYMPGPKIRCKDDLYRFIEDISKGVDDYKDERKRINNLVNQYQDGKSCERLLKYSKMI